MNIVITILIFGLIVAFHEFGHFIIAKANDITVSEFSIGMGPRLASFERKGTRYSLKLFPIGGSCAMGEDEVAGENDKHAFNNKNVWQRISVIFAGPFFNFVMAFILAMVIIGIIGYDPAYVTSVNASQPVYETGLQTMDIITAVNGKKISIGRDVAAYFEFNSIDGSEITLDILRDGESKEIKFIPEYVKNYMLGFSYPGYDDSCEAEIIDIYDDYPLKNAGLEIGDIIVKVNDTPIETAKDFTMYVSAYPLSEEEIILTYKRENVEYTVNVTPLFVSEGYTLGFTYNTSYREKTNVLGVVKYSFIEVKYWIVTTIKSLGKLITGQLSADSLGGPVRIVSEISKVVEESKTDGTLYVILNLLNWSVLLSANLGVMNLLPIPALDGGRLMFLFLEVVRGKPIDKEKEGMVHLIGIVLLMILVVLVFLNDIKNVFF